MTALLCAQAELWRVFMGHAGLAWVPALTPGTVGEGVGCSMSLMSKVLGGGAVGSPPGLSLPAAPKVEPLKLAEAFLAPAAAVWALAYVPFLFQWEVSV